MQLEERNDICTSMVDLIELKTENLDDMYGRFNTISHY